VESHTRIRVSSGAQGRNIRQNDPRIDFTDLTAGRWRLVPRPAVRRARQDYRNTGADDQVMGLGGVNTGLPCVHPCAAHVTGERGDGRGGVAR